MARDITIRAIQSRRDKQKAGENSKKIRIKEILKTGKKGKKR